MKTLYDIKKNLLYASLDERMKPILLEEAIDGLTSVLTTESSSVASQELTDILNSLSNILLGTLPSDALDEYINRLEILENDYTPDEEELW